MFSLVKSTPCSTVREASSLQSLWLWSEDIILMRADRKRWMRREHRLTRERESWKGGTVKGQISTYHRSFLFCLFVIKMKEFKLQTDIKACQYIHTYRCNSNKDITCETKTSRESVWVTSALLTYANIQMVRDDVERSDPVSRPPDFRRHELWLDEVQTCCKQELVLTV